MRERCPARGRGARSPRPRTRSSWGRSDSSDRGGGISQRGRPRSGRAGSTGWLAEGRSREEPVQLSADLAGFETPGSGARDHHHVGSRRQPAPGASEPLADRPLDPVARDGISNSTAHGDAQPGRRAPNALGRRRLQDDEMTRGPPRPLSSQPAEVLGAAEAVGPSQPADRRGHATWTRPPRPGACAPSLDAASGSPGRPWSSSGPGSRGAASA